MPDTPKRSLSHIYLQKHGKREKYTRNSGGGGQYMPPSRERFLHAKQLQDSLANAIGTALEKLEQRDPAQATGTPGLYLDIELTPEGKKVLDSLEDRRKGKEPIELLTVTKTEDGKLNATVFVPQSRLDVYTKKIDDYADPGKDIAPNKPKNEKLVASIETIRLSNLQLLFTDALPSFPKPGQEVWWEIWLRIGTRSHFEHTASQLGIQFSDHSVKFVEREVLLALATPELLAQLLELTDALAEVRLAKDNPAFFMRLSPYEQKAWSQELTGRSIPPADDAPAVCILDSGTTYRHSLIQPALNPKDQQAWQSSWSVEDTGEQWRGHGTEMSGIALYGDLVDIFNLHEPVALTHCLESVKILPDTGQNKPELYGLITGDSIAYAELEAPKRRRVVCLPVTAPSANMLGQPTQWSAALDDLLYSDGQSDRLIVVSAGNTSQNPVKSDYIDLNDTSPVENPAQAWNALTVGAYTEKINITEPDYQDWEVLGKAGDLSPHSRTGVAWSTEWLNKPDIVLEGGNVGLDSFSGLGFPVDSLELLTTYKNPEERQFTTTQATSAATALAARLGAQIVAARPNLWPETVRALMVHSAEWTEAMLQRLPSTPKKSDYRTLVRRYGYGVPDFSRAMGSLNNDVTLVIEDQLQPFEHAKGMPQPQTRDMMLHSFTWPRHLLEQLGEAQVQMRVTLSYYIEPNPGERGWTKRHTYASHGLRFRVKSAEDNLSTFRKKINKAAQEAEEGVYRQGGDDQSGWLFGSNFISKGSVHSDIWSGNAVDLERKDAIAIFPVGGWWKEKPAFRRSERSIRYALIVSLRVLNQPDIDIYTPISNTISSEVEIEIDI